MASLATGSCGHLNELMSMCETMIQHPLVQKYVEKLNCGSSSATPTMVVGMTDHVRE
jgi:hypothetical protein